LFSKQGLAVTGIIATLSFITSKKRFFNLPLTFVSIFIILVPLIPLILTAGISQPGRYLFLPWIALCIGVATVFQPHKENKEAKIYITFKYCCAALLIASCFTSHSDEVQHFKEPIRLSEDIYRFTVESDFSKKGLVINRHGTADEYWAYVSTAARRAYDLSNNIPLQPLVIITSEVHSINSLPNLASTTQSSTQFYQYQYGIFKAIDIKPILSTFLDKIKAGENQWLNVKFKYKRGLLSWNLQPSGIAYSAIVWQNQTDLRYREIPLNGTGSYPWNIDAQTDISLSFKDPSGWIAISPKITIDPKQRDVIWQGKSEVTSMIKKLESYLQY
jgi:hypothetical protein